ncbi:MAG: site-2 protease family protein [Gammaproteobacteria bacterium]|nr:site-2 protease family protein [Gammaproteobacteria bacterium]
MGAGSTADFIRMIAVGAIPVVFAITLHEVAHGWMARRHGDRTAEMLGRLSLNPLRHIDPMGTVVVPLLTLWLGGLLFGWAKPVPINPRAMREPKRAMIAVAAAGPGANLLMALGWALVLRLAAGLMETLPVAGDFLVQMASLGISFNVLLGIFNLLPVPPLDGGRVLRGLVPESIGRRLDAIEPYGLIIVVGLLVAGVLNRVLGPLFLVARELVFLLAGVKGG